MLVMQGRYCDYSLVLGGLLPEVTYVTDYAQSLGKRPNRELLEALTSLGAVCEGTGPEGYVPITIRGGNLHGGRVTISGARSSQYFSSLLFLAPLIDEPLDIVVVDNLKSQALMHVTLNVLEEAGIVIEYDETLRHFSIAAGQDYPPRQYVVPGDYPSAAALLAACAVATDPGSEICLSGLRAGERDGDMLLRGFAGYGGRYTPGGRYRYIARWAAGCVGLKWMVMERLIVFRCWLLLHVLQREKVFFIISRVCTIKNLIVSMIYVLSCDEPDVWSCARQDAIIVRGQPQGVEGGVSC